VSKLDNPIGRDTSLTKVYRIERTSMTRDDFLALGWNNPQAEKLAHDGHRKVRVIVMVGSEDEGTTGYLYEMTHWPFHSPTGFEYGYGGSGPAELARCILIDFYGIVPTSRPGSTLYENADLPVSYQAFKEDFIAGKSGSMFDITGEEIASWAARNQPS
jgi:hypothetical protein